MFQAFRDKNNFFEERAELEKKVANLLKKEEEQEERLRSLTAENVTLHKDIDNLREEIAQINQKVTQEQSLNLSQNQTVGNKKYI